MCDKWHVVLVVDLVCMSAFGLLAHSKVLTKVQPLWRNGCVTCP